MKAILFSSGLILIMSMLIGCDKKHREKTPDHTNAEDMQSKARWESSPTSEQSQVVAKLRSTIKVPIEQQYGKVRQTVPAITKLGKGTFDDAGLQDVFHQITGQIMTTEIQPVSGWYSVFDEMDWDGRYRMVYHGLYTTTPANARELIDYLKDKWKREYAHRPDWKITEFIINENRNGDHGLKITPGTVILGVTQPDSRIRESYSATIDPNTGMMMFNFYGGPTDD